MDKRTLTFTEPLAHSRKCFMCPPFCNLFNDMSGQTRPDVTARKTGSERQSNLLKTTQLMSGGAGV